MKSNSRYKIGSGVKWSFLYFVLILMLVVSIYPILFSWFAAFKTKQELMTSPNPLSFPKSFTLKNFADAWTVGRMGRYMLNSICVTVPTVIGVLFLASMAGFGFGKLKFPGRDKAFFFILLGMMIPGQALIISLYYVVVDLKLVNNYLGVILPTLGTAMPFACFMMRSFYKDLPDELMDSARIDGCNLFCAFIRVYFPLTFPALSALMIFQFMWVWNDLQLPLLIFFDDNVRTLPLGLKYFSGEFSSNQALIAAGVTICTFPIILLYVIFQRTFIRGITAGAVKG